MKETISINEKSFKILNDLILNGFYEGFISPDRFELSRKQGWLNRGGDYRIVGIANNEQKFELNFEVKSHNKHFLKVFFGLGILFTLVFLARGEWWWPLFFLFPALMIYITFTLKKRKEIRLLTSKFLQLYRLEYEKE